MQPPKDKRLRIKREETETPMEFVEKLLQAAPATPGDDDINKILKGEDEATEPNADPLKTAVTEEETSASQEKTVTDLVTEIIQGDPEIEEEVDPEFLNDFLVETAEHLENIEMKILALETDPANNELINDLFRSFHTIKGLAGFVNQNVIRKIAHQTETRLDKCRKGETKVSKYFVDLILASADYLKKICDNLSLNKDSEFLASVEVHLKTLNKETEPTADWEQKVTDGNTEYQAVKIDKIGEILVGEGLAPETVGELLAKQEEYPGLKFGQVAVKEKKAEVQDVIKSLRIQEKASSLLSPDGGYGGYTRVPTLKIDNLVDLIGELVIIQSQIEQEAVKRFGTNDAFINRFLRMEKISKDIQNISMSLRMISLKSTFQKINRIGRDTIAELDKNVSLEFLGEETEIDRGVAEKLLDPLLHLVKNAISHGIESGPERQEKNKPVQGLIKIQAYSKRGSVYIEVSDDGRGISLETIHRKALEHKLIDPLKTPADEELLNLVFQPGFSTAEEIDNISGRGVGLDVVKTEISKIGGKVEINNRPGEGCCFILKIPINLAVINGTIVDL